MIDPEGLTYVGIIGAGTMGTGIAQVSAEAGFNVIMFDAFPEALTRAESALFNVFERLVQKEKITVGESEKVLKRIKFTENPNELSSCSLVVEAIVEDLDAKKSTLRRVEEIVSSQCLITSNTSSLSITSLASVLRRPERFLGMHFFNPAPLLPLVEIVPGIRTSTATTKSALEITEKWQKTPVLAKDTPGFIVNRIARPFYSEPLRMLEEGIANVPTIDWAMREIGGFRMGPFELMDLIGNDVNYTVTHTIWTQFYFEPRFKPSIIQKRMVEAGLLGRKSGRGFYDYGNDAIREEPKRDQVLGREIFLRTLAMLVNEAIDAVRLNIASPDDIDLAMTMGVNYPKGLLKWANELGLETILARIVKQFEEYGEDRYRLSPLLRQMVVEKRKFFS